ncbi:UNVERIFIED_CONTAM: hypothetical protein GTU68_062514 [Idotea baltica]|nr:hypothetical protein [Idotea baltica]
MKIYTYKNCGTCRKAVKWLRENDIEFDEIPIRDTPPSQKELKAMLKNLGGSSELRRLFNTSGGDYRALDLKTKLPGMSEADAIKLLSGNGNLIKRPFLLLNDAGTVGFSESVWSDLLLS